MDRSGVGIDTAMMELQSRQLKLCFFLFLVDQYLRIYTMCVSSKDSSSSYTVEYGGLAEQVSPQCLLLGPYRNLGAASIHDVGGWVGELW
jgi:hypothetical protein